MKLATCLLILALSIALPTALESQQPAPMVPPAESGPRASMVSFQLPSHGALLNAFVYVAAGEGPHPAVILLHGFPGNEKNLDLAQAMRRAGWDVLFFNYRGSWGSPGDFSFAHSVEDTAAAVAYLRDPAHAKALRLDPQHIVVIGHSMGGFMAVVAAANDPTIAAVGLISAADMAGRIPNVIPPAQESYVVPRIATSLAHEGMAPLAGCTPESLAHELSPTPTTGASRGTLTPTPRAPPSSSPPTTASHPPTTPSPMPCAPMATRPSPAPTSPPTTPTPTTAKS